LSARGRRRGSRILDCSDNIDTSNPQCSAARLNRFFAEKELMKAEDS
jgi:hypothetical protein